MESEPHPQARAESSPNAAAEPRSEEIPLHDVDSTSPDASAQVSPRGRRHVVVFAATVILIAAALAYRPLLNSYNQQQTDQLRNRCKVAAATQDWDRLRSTAQQWLDWDSSSNDAMIFLADAEIQFDELDRAVHLLGQIDDSYHGVLESLAIRAELLFSDLNRPFEAEKTWQRMLKINGEAAVAHQRLIYFYAMTLQRDKMLRQIFHAIEMKCEPPEAYSYLVLANVLNFSDGLTRLTRWRRNYPDDETLEVAQAVYAAKKSADNGIATFGTQVIAPGETMLLDRCLEKYPSNPEVLALQIEFAMFQGDSAPVIDLLSNISERSENDSRFWRYRGWVLDQNRKFDDAAESLEKALELHPYDWQARWLLADVYRKLDRIPDADQQSRIAAKGKDLQRKLFERPTARELGEELVQELYGYIGDLNVSEVKESLSRRL